MCIEDRETIVCGDINYNMFIYIFIYKYICTSILLVLLLRNTGF